MRMHSRILFTTAGKHAHTHTHTHIRMPLWFEGFIGASQSHQTGREEGAATHFQERRHLLAANSVSPGPWDDPDYAVLSFTWFTSTKV